MTTRKFIHKRGFMGQTQHIECNDDTDECFHVDIHGEKIQDDGYTIELCEYHVANGNWIEIGKTVTGED